MTPLERINQRISSNPQVLEQYWQNNPQALQNAMTSNPAAFNKTPAQQIANRVASDPNQLAKYYQQNPHALTQDVKNNPAAFAPPTGLIGSETALTNSLNSATNTLSPYGGGEAAQLMKALTGALGPEAQGQAYKDFRQSPGTKYLMKQGEKALTRNAAATGGLGGGNILKALQGHAMGLAMQDFDNSFNRLGMVSSQGLNADQSLANMQYGAGLNQSANRLNFGRDLAQNLSGTNTALADLINKQGQGHADTFDAYSGNLANLLAGSGADQGASTQALMTLLANIATGSGTQVAGLPGVPGVTPTDGIAGDLLKIFGMG